MNHEDIQKKISTLNHEMLLKRIELNEEHYYPKLRIIQEECAKIGHGALQPILTLFLDDIEHYKCGYCGARLNDNNT